MPEGDLRLVVKGQCHSARGNPCSVDEGHTFSEKESPRIEWIQ
jgi:hypothetical protein